MARTPVPIDEVKLEQNMESFARASERTKRTPVVVEETTAEEAEVTVALVEAVRVAAENGAMDTKPRHEVKPIIDGYRECARPDCTASFKPRSINPKDTEATEYYCSDDCAIHEFYRKRGLGPVPEKIVSGASQASSRAHREEKKRKRIEAAPEHDAKYGPMRKVIEVLGETKTAKKVKLECGHITAARGDQQRCRKCRAGRPIEAAAAPKERSVKRQPVTRATVKKSKRTPVKPPKRGKKGKK